MLAYSFYESDNRVMRYAETLAKRGDFVDVIALRKDGRDACEITNGVNVFRIQYRIVNEKWQLSYFWRVLQFFFRSMLFLAKKQLQYRYDVVHVHSIPDFLVFAAWLPKLMGSKIILDLHDLVPELYANKFKKGQDSLLPKLLIAIERASVAYSDQVIIPNHLWEEKLQARSATNGKCKVILNFPDRTIFSRRGHCKCRDEKFNLLYPGTLNWHQGLDIAIRAFGLIKDQAPNAQLHIYGDGPAKDSLVQLARSLHLQDRVFFHPCLPLREIATVMEKADLGVVPKRNDSFGNEAFSTKILEFMALGVPVIVSDTKIDQYYFNSSIVQFFRGGDEKSLAACMLRLINDAGLRRRLAQNAFEFISQNNWDANKAQYLVLIDSLTGNGSTRAPSVRKLVPVLSGDVSDGTKRNDQKQAGKQELWKRVVKLAISVGFAVVDWMSACVSNLLGRQRPAASVILCYHEIACEYRHRFARQMDVLIRWAKPICADNKMPIPTRCGIHHAAIVFHDGYVSVIENALPDLVRRNIPATLFVPTSFLGGFPDWIKNQEHPALSESIVTAEQLRSLDPKLIAVGSHTRTHRNLTTLTEREAREELCKSKLELEAILQRPVELLAFPYGEYNQALVEWSRDAGYQRVFSCMPTLAFTDPEEFLTGTIDVSPLDWRWEFKLKLLGAYRWLPFAFTLKRRIILALRKWFRQATAEQAPNEARDRC